MRGSRPKAQWYSETEADGGDGVGKFAVVFEVEWARLLCSCSPTTELNIFFQYIVFFVVFLLSHAVSSFVGV